MGRRGVILFSHSTDETFAFGHRLGMQLPQGSVVGFFGDLAAGKTTFIKGLASAATGTPPSSVSSPTFVLLNIYEGERALYHFDLYRLKNAEEFFGMGFDDYWHSAGISCIEWAERIEGQLPEKSIKVRIRVAGEEERIIDIEGFDGFH
jgi:tRNA threonylcarbamoyladenosine biosynthesis protein TsaE